MTRFLNLSSRLYQMILLLYPLSLRRDFGTDMAEVFVQDLKDAWERRHIRGVTRVWWSAVSEIPWIAISREPLDSALLAMLVSLACHFALLGAAMVLLGGARTN